MDIQLFDAYASFIASGSVDLIHNLDNAQRGHFRLLLDTAHQKDDMRIASHIQQGKQLIVVAPREPQFRARLNRLSNFVSKEVLAYTTKWIGLSAFDRYKIAGWMPSNLVVLVLDAALKDSRMEDTIQYLKTKADTFIYDIPM